jgi:hypothetical protein
MVEFRSGSKTLEENAQLRSDMQTRVSVARLLSQAKARIATTWAWTTETR